MGEISHAETGPHYASVAGEEKKDGDESKTDEKLLPNNSGSTATQKKKYTDWPVREIREPHDNDVLYGRGGE